MRRLTLPLALAAALALAGCGGGAQPADPSGGTSSAVEETTAAEETPSAEDTTPAAPAGDELPSVEGGFGEQPSLTFPASGAPGELRVETISAGEGAEVGEGDYIIADYIGQVWGAEAPFNDSWDMGAPIGFSLNGVIPGWSEGIPGAHVGDRLLLSIPSDMGYGDAGQPAAGINGGDTLVFVIDVLGTYPEGNWFGQADAKDTGAIATLPVTVTGALGTQPSIQ